MASGFASTEDDEERITCLVEQGFTPGKLYLVAPTVVRKSHDRLIMASEPISLPQHLLVAPLWPDRKTFSH